MFELLDALAAALYVAPEHLDGHQRETGSPLGDVYSFAIICSVILTMKPAYGIDEGENVLVVGEH